MKQTRRVHHRVLFSVPFTLSYMGAEGSRISRGMTLDISEGGMGAMLQSDAPVGETVHIQVPIREREIRTSAIVRHSGSGRSGFQFLGLSEDDRNSIAAFTKKPTRMA